MPGRFFYAYIPNERPLFVHFVHLLSPVSRSVSFLYFYRNRCNIIWQNKQGSSFLQVSWKTRWDTAETGNTLPALCRKRCSKPSLRGSQPGTLLHILQVTTSLNQSALASRRYNAADIMLVVPAISRPRKSAKTICGTALPVQVHIPSA